MKNLESIASHEWFSRPADQRFPSLAALQSYTDNLRSQSRTITGSAARLRFVPDSASLAIEAPLAGQLALSNWSYGQLSTLASASVPGSGVVAPHLPPHLACEVLNHALARSERKVQLYHAGQSLRAATGPDYGRVYDSDAVRLLSRLGDAYGLEQPPDWHTKQTGELSGLFASDRDMFGILISGGSIVEAGTHPVTGRQDTLHRGVIIRNSETGAGHFEILGFLFRAICGNLGLMGAELTFEARLRHNRCAPEHFASLVRDSLPQIEDHMHRGTAEELTAINLARDTMLPAERADRIEILRGRKIGMSEAEACRTLDMAVETEGDDRTVWQVMNGATAVARDMPHRDTALAMTRKAQAMWSLC